MYIKAAHHGDGEKNMWHVHVADGTARILGSLVVWLAALAVAESSALSAEDFADPTAIAAITTLFNIPSLMDTAVDALDSRIGSIARQNQNAKITPVTSYQWAAMLVGMSSHGLTLAAAMRKYKDQSLALVGRIKPTFLAICFRLVCLALHTSLLSGVVSSIISFFAPPPHQSPHTLRASLGFQLTLCPPPLVLFGSQFGHVRSTNARA